MFKETIADVNKEASRYDLLKSIVLHINSSADLQRVQAASEVPAAG